jgi:multidrug efflux pump subunit AcrB
MPTAFVSGMMGQFLRALPIGASVAMVYSLFIALAVTPYLAYRLLRHPSRENGSEDASPAADGPATSSVSTQPRVGHGAWLARRSASGPQPSSCSSDLWGSLSLALPSSRCCRLPMWTKCQ